MSVERKSNEETMTKRLAFRKSNGQNSVPLYLNETAALAGWPTPRHSDAGPRGGTTGFGLGDTTRLAGWGTPTSQDGKHAGVSPAEAARDPNVLRVQVHTAGWATPSARDWKDTPTPNVETNALLGRQAWLAAPAIPGASLNGSTASTASAGLLNPEFSRWLNGVPATWPSCAPTATRSIRSSRRSS
jgi:hypothetical protein